MTHGPVKNLSIFARNAAFKNIWRKETHGGDVVMENHKLAGRLLFGDSAVVPEEDAWGAEFAYFEEDIPENAPDAYLLYDCEGVPMRVELNRRGGRVCMGSEKRAKAPYADCCYVSGRGVRKRHALFRRIGTQYFVRCLDARSEIFINGRAVKSCASRLLRDGDKIRMGSAEVLFRKRPQPKAGTRFGF